VVENGRGLYILYISILSQWEISQTYHISHPIIDYYQNV
jgi:hypothetical protein